TTGDTDGDPQVTDSPTDGGDGDGDGDGSAANSTVTIAVADEPATLDMAAGSIAEINLAENIFDSLVDRQQSDGGVFPQLATTWDVSDDELTWTFNLRDDVSFTNGEKFNAAAVKYSIERFLAEDYTTSFASYWTALDEIEVVDDYTVAFHLNEPNPILDLTMPWHSLVVPPEYTEEVGNEEFGQAPIGTGPYKLKEWIRGDRIILEANEDYFAGAPEIKEVVFRFIEDPGARVAALLSGEVDIATPISIEQVSEVENADGYSVKEPDFSILRDRIMFYASKEPFDDVRVRQAVWHAIDRQSIVDNILQGYGQVTNGPIVEGEFGWRPELEEYGLEYDPERARQLLEEAGYPDGFEVTFDTRPGTFPKDDETPEAIAQYLSEVGITANIVENEYAQFIEKASTGELGEMAIGLMVGGGNFHAFHTFKIFLDCNQSSGVWNPKDENGEGIYSCYPSVDELAREALVTQGSDPERSLELYEEAYRTAVQDETVSVFLWSYNVPAGVSDRVDWEPTIQGDYLVYDASING
ncbi:MAG: ABC transporter substrate-binding protein, partial [Halobacteriales archaeon]|nr:ABC transporter substrate-binding protein [Halobacteriales archaeon]